MPMPRLKLEPLVKESLEMARRGEIGNLYRRGSLLPGPLEPIMCIKAGSIAETVSDEDCHFHKLNRAGEGFEHESLAFDRIVNGPHGPQHGVSASQHPWWLPVLWHGRRGDDLCRPVQYGPMW